MSGDATVFTNPLIAIGTGTASADRNLSNRARSLSWTEEFEDHDITTFGDTRRAHAVGLGDSTLDLEFLQSYATADGGENVDLLFNTILDLSASGKAVLFRFRPINAARNATNPEYSMLVRMTGRTIADGEIGAVLTNPISLLAAGDITRATATT